MEIALILIVIVGVFVVAEKPIRTWIKKQIQSWRS